MFIIVATKTCGMTKNLSKHSAVTFKNIAREGR